MQRPDPERRERWAAAASFTVTCVMVALVYGIGWSTAPAAAARWGDSIQFSACLMGILLAHELGHLALAYRHGIPMSWPWFVPFPFFVGTLGAVMRLHEAPRTRVGLLAMGLAGPLAGFTVVASVLVFWAWEAPSAPEGSTLATPLVFHLVHLAVQGTPAPPPSTGDPLAFAAWNGCLLTGMNLLPLGQLDGGHAAASIWPSQSRWVGVGTTCLLLVLGLWWPGWALWAAAVYLMGASRPIQARAGRVTARQAAIGLGLHAATFALVFTPVPVGGLGLW